MHATSTEDPRELVQLLIGGEADVNYESVFRRTALGATEQGEIALLTDLGVERS